MVAESKRRKVFFCTQAGVRQKRALVSSFLRWRKEALGRAGQGRAGQGDWNPGVVVLILR